VLIKTSKYGESYNNLKIQISWATFESKKSCLKGRQKLANLITLSIEGGSGWQLFKRQLKKIKFVRFFNFPKPYSKTCHLMLFAMTSSVF